MPKIQTSVQAFSPAIVTMGVSTRSTSSMKTRSGNSLRGPLGAMSLKSPHHRKSRRAKPSKISTPVSVRRKANTIAKTILSGIRKVEHIGGTINYGMFDFLNYRPTLTRYLEDYLRRRGTVPSTKLWISLKSEPLNQQDGRHEPIIRRFNNVNLPIIVAVESKVAPIDYTCKVSLQDNRKEFLSFEQAGLGWAEAGDVNFLRSVSGREATRDDNYALLPLKRPSMINSIEAEPVREVEVEYKGISITARTRNDVVRAIEVDSDLDLDEDLDPLIEAVRAEKHVHRERNEARVHAERNRFVGMIKSISADNGIEMSSVEASLDAMRVYKIYPEYEHGTLPPPRRVEWCGECLVIGNVKNGKLDSLFGNVDSFY